MFILLLEPLVLLVVPQFLVVDEDEVGHLGDPRVGDGHRGERVAVHKATSPSVNKLCDRTKVVKVLRDRI